MYREFAGLQRMHPRRHFDISFNLRLVDSESADGNLAGPDPLFNGDETEGDLDVEWAGAVAPAAKILFVIGEGTEATAGIDLSAEYIVDNNLAPVLSESFTSCEGNLEQEGITSFLCRTVGTSGSAGHYSRGRGRRFGVCGVRRSGFGNCSGEWFIRKWNCFDAI